MSSTTTTVRPVNFARVLRSEFIKFRSLPIVWILLGVTLAVLIGFAALQSLAMVQRYGGENQLPPEVVHMSASGGVPFGQLFIASLGAVFIGSEYGTGMIRSTMTAAPRRWAPVLAKAVVMGLASLVTGAIGILIGFLVGQPILNTEDLGYSLTTPGVLGSMGGSVLYLMFATVLGLGLGALFRSSVAGICAIVGLLFVVPIGFSFIPLDFIDTIHTYLPDGAGELMAEIDTTGETLNQWQGGLVSLAWVALTYIAALILVKKRDV